MIGIRPYQPAADEPGVFDLWQATLGQTWPLTRDLFRRVTIGANAYRDGDHFVAEEAGACLGFVATQNERDARSQGNGHLCMVLVAPEWQRRGIGRALHAEALLHLRDAGADRVQLGGGDVYLWPGVPSTQQPALAFFRACGWDFTGTSYDLVQDLRRYAPPPDLHRRVAEQHISLEIGRPDSVGETLTFVAQEFRSWEAAYRSVAALSDYGDFLLARERGGRIIGALILYTPLSHSRRIDVRWKLLLGEDAGAIGVVGVAAAMQGRGIGHALVARASEILRDRQARLGFIGWAWMIGLYGEMGYSVWREYRMSQRNLLGSTPPA